MIPRRNSVEYNPFLIERGTRPLLVAHGGGNLEFPGNTLEALFNTYSVYPNAMFELDVNMTRDGVIILSHCTTLDRRTNVQGNIHDWYYTDLIAQEVNFNFFSPIRNGVRIDPEILIPFTNYAGRTVTPRDVSYPYGVRPRHDTIFLATTLEEVITTFPNNTISVEIKQRGEIGLAALDTVIDMMVRLDARYNTFGRMVLASFHSEIFERLVELRATHPNLMFSPNESGLITLYMTHWVGLDWIYNTPITMIQIPTRQGSLPLDTRLFIRAVQRHNIAVHYWTINNEEDMRHLIAQGADGITTGRPTLLKSILDELFP